MYKKRSNPAREKYIAQVNTAFAQFKEKFRTEEDCLRAIQGHVFEGNPVSCKYCQNTDGEMQEDERCYYCYSCKKISSITAGSFFHGIRILELPLLIIWFAERGIAVSASRISKLLSISSSTAANALKKTKFVLLSELNAHSKVVDLYSALFCPVYGKRSAETLARQHPISEQEEVDKTTFDQWSESESSMDSEQNGRDTSQNKEESKNHELSEREQVMLSFFSDEPVSSECLLELSGLSESMFSHSILLLLLSEKIKPMPGDRYIKVEIDSTRKTQILSKYQIEPKSMLASEIKEFQEFIQLVFHRVSRKMLQLYVALFWCIKDRTRWGEGSVFRACKISAEISERQIRSYVTPAVVRFATQLN